MSIFISTDAFKELVFQADGWQDTWDDKHKEVVYEEKTVRQVLKVKVSISQELIQAAGKKKRGRPRTQCETMASAEVIMEAIRKHLALVQGDYPHNVVTPTKISKIYLELARLMKLPVPRTNMTLTSFDPVRNLI